MTLITKSRATLFSGVTFLDGPAKGEQMWLLNDVSFLRVTKKGEYFNALDSANDRLPKPPYEIFCYVAMEIPYRAWIKNATYCHAVYRLYKPQPPIEVMQSQVKWDNWVRNAKGPTSPTYHPMTGRRLT